MKKRRKIRGLIVALVTFISIYFLAACSGQDDIKWEKYNSTQLGYSIEFPGPYEEDGQTITYEVSNDEAYLVMATDFGQGALDGTSIDLILDGSIEVGIGENKILEQREYEHQGQIGREVVYNDIENESFVKMRMFIVGDRLYQISYTSRQEEDLKLDEVNGFFNSLSIDQKYIDDNR